MDQGIRVLCINVDSNEFGGVSIFLMNVYRNIDHKKFQMDFLTPGKSPYYPFHREIKSSGGRIFEFHVNYGTLAGKIAYARKLILLLKENSYDIIHINSGSLSLNYISSKIAKSMNIKVIEHSHNADSSESQLKRLLSYPIKMIMQKNADVLCACSKAAARYLFTKRKVENNQVIIIKNGIDLHKFQYNEEIRNRIRKELNLEGHYIIGHVGRFVEQKNHEFLIDIFSEILKKEPSAILLLVGQGELEPVIHEKVKKLNIEDNVMFLGARNDVGDLYQAMDVFLFPSLFEGMPITLIEAQDSGIPCCISDTITTEVELTDLIYWESLNKSPQVWASTVLSILSNDDKRSSYELILKEAGYGAANTAVQISKLYEMLI